MNKIAYIISTCTSLVGEEAYMTPLQQNAPKL